MVGEACTELFPPDAVVELAVEVEGLEMGGQVGAAVAEDIEEGFHWEVLASSEVVLDNVAVVGLVAGMVIGTVVVEALVVEVAVDTVSVVARLEEQVVVVVEVVRRMEAGLVVPGLEQAD